MSRAFTIWLTGRPRSGKSTLGRLLARALNDLGAPAQHLDGGLLRRQLWPELGFSPAEQSRQARRVTHLANMLNNNGVICVAELISPQAADRRQARLSLGEFVEAHLDCPLEQALNRDASGLYQRALNGEISGLPGFDAPYEAPEEPEIYLQTHRQSPGQCLEAVFSYLERAGMLDEVAPKASDARASVYSPGEERQITARLQALGYI